MTIEEQMNRFVSIFPTDFRVQLFSVVVFDTILDRLTMMPTLENVHHQITFQWKYRSTHSTIESMMTIVSILNLLVNIRYDYSLKKQLAYLNRKETNPREKTSTVKLT